EDDQIVWRTVSEQVECRLAILGDLDGVPLLLQTLTDEVGDFPLVLHHQDSHGGFRVLSGRLRVQWAAALGTGRETGFARRERLHPSRRVQGHARARGARS